MMYVFMCHSNLPLVGNLTTSVLPPTHLHRYEKINISFHVHVFILHGHENTQF